MNGAILCGATRSQAPEWMLPEDLVEGPDWIPCCMGSVNDGPMACTCWRPVFDMRQRKPRTDVEPRARAKACHDCAYRQGSPERERGEDLDAIATRGVFWCHQGLRRPKAWRHPDGRVRPVDLTTSPDYQPPMLNQVPYKANGQPADRCGGWAALARVSGPQIVLAADLIDDEGGPLEWNAAGMADAAERAAFHGDGER